MESNKINIKSENIQIGMQLLGWGVRRGVKWVMVFNKNNI